MKVLTGPTGGLVKAWVDGVEFEEEAQKQVLAVSELPFIFKHVAVMPDAHAGLGATVGSVIPTLGAIIPAAVGVDIGCGMVCLNTGLRLTDLDSDLSSLRAQIENAVPHGRTDNGGKNDRGAWGQLPSELDRAWTGFLSSPYNNLVTDMPELKHPGAKTQFGTLGTGNHFIELSTDEIGRVWVVIHSGSRGIGNKIGQTFINCAKGLMNKYFISLSDKNLAYLPEGTKSFDQYIRAVNFAQGYAKLNRHMMMSQVLKVLGLKYTGGDLPDFSDYEFFDCHHNYVANEHHFGQNVWVTRKGAVRAMVLDRGIIPGSMGERSYIVEGKGDRESFASCSHGAGRRMSRTEAKRTFTVEDHAKATQGVECRKDIDVLDETPLAYKRITDVMAAQTDLVRCVHEIKQVLCVKG